VSHFPFLSFTMSAPIVDMGIEADDAPLCVSEYWPSTEADNNSGQATTSQSSAQQQQQQATPRGGASWWEGTNWFRVQERRQMEEQYAAQQAARGLPVTAMPLPAPGPAVAPHPASYAVSHPLHDDPAAAVEYGGIGEDGSQLGERYSGKSMRGIGSNLGQGSVRVTPAAAPSPTASSTPLTEQQRLAFAPGGAEVFCRFNTSSSSARAAAAAAAPVVLAPTSVATATPAPLPSTGVRPVPMPSLMERAISTGSSSARVVTAPPVVKQPSTRLRLACIQGYSAAVKRQLHELVVLPLFHPTLFSRIGVRSSRGVILAGASGSGQLLSRTHRTRVASISFCCLLLTHVFFMLFGFILAFVFVVFVFFLRQE
jgi:hypothetical protein